MGRTVPARADHAVLGLWRAGSPSLQLELGWDGRQPRLRTSRKGCDLGFHVRGRATRARVNLGQKMTKRHESVTDGPMALSTTLTMQEAACDSEHGRVTMHRRGHAEVRDRASGDTSLDRGRCREPGRERGRLKLQARMRFLLAPADHAAKGRSSCLSVRGLGASLRCLRQVEPGVPALAEEGTAHQESRSAAVRGGESTDTWLWGWLRCSNDKHERRGSLWTPL